MTMLLGAFQLLNPNGTVGVSWRHPENTSLAYLTIDYWTGIAQSLEASGFDFLFFADSYGYPTTADGSTIAQGLIDATNVPLADPITVVSAVAAATDSLGIIVTSSTTIERPAALARRYGTLDHLTDGRIGWNIVTGGHESSAALMGEAQTPHDMRYAIADDHVAICLKLWEGSWADDALVADKEGGVYADPTKVRQISHEGEHLSAKGLFGVPPSPQRTPLLVQAGSSPAGKELAAKYAEIVFIGGGDDVEKVKSHIADIRAKLVANGRGADAIKFVVGVSVLLGADQAEAERKRAQMLEFATLEQAATNFTWLTGFDIAAYPMDEPLPDLESEQGQSLIEALLNPGTGPRKTPRQIITDYRDKGHFGQMYVGTGEQVATALEAYQAATGLDGFLIQPHITPGTYQDIADYLAPVLRERGLIGTAEGDTLRARIFPATGDRLPAPHVADTYRFRSEA
jgi:FMN-dependent oxidoreductase (nitrilotriacetate monooxygenase family)